MIIRFEDGEFEIHAMSQKDYTGVAFVDIPNGALIYNSCFSQETPNSMIFRPNMRDVTFRNCNLMNVHIPQPNNNTLIDCQEEVFEIQNDLNDWILGINGLPDKPLNHRIFTKLGLPMPLPQDIPAVRQSKRVDLLEIAKGLV